MKTVTKRISVLLMVVCLLATLVLPAAALTTSDIPTTEIITTPSGYTSASDVTYPSSGYIANWGARGELATFVSAKAADYYTSGSSRTAKTLSELQSEEFIYNTLYWDPDIWYMIDGENPTLKCFID